MPTTIERHPVLMSPFVSALHPLAGQIQDQTVCWADQHGLIQSLHDRHRLNTGHYSLLMARAYPTANPLALQLIADWNTWTFLLDDHLDEHVVGRDPDAVERLHSRILAILGGADVRPDDPVRVRALHQIACRLRANHDGEWMQRFTMCVRDTLAASLWEARNRRTKSIPTEDDYSYWRLFTSGVYCYFTLIEVAEHINLPAFVLDHPVIQQLTRSANYAICWSNDIFSFSKEIARGDVHNLVYIIQHERNMTIDEALVYVAQRHDAEVKTFQRLMKQLPRFGGSIDTSVNRYAQGLQAWIRANMDWSVATERYCPPSA